MHSYTCKYIFAPFHTSIALAVSTARAMHGGCTSLAPLLFMCCQTCTLTHMRCICCSRAAARSVPHCLQARWQGPRAHHPAACPSGWAQPPPPHMCGGLLLTHPPVLILWDCHTADTHFGTGGEGQRPPQRSLSPELHLLGLLLPVQSSWPVSPSTLG